jgi:chorismate synthase
MGNVFGKLFTIATWGESHGGGVAPADIQADLDRRRPGQSELTTQRKEADAVSIISGVYEGRTLGTPIAMLVANTDARPEAYAEMREKFRPSHADYTYLAKFGLRNHEGGGRSSARETIGRVAAGAIAKKILALGGVEIRAYVERVQNISMPGGDALTAGEKVPFPSLAQVEANPVRCPDAAAAEKMAALIKKMRSAGDSVGGALVCRVRGLPAGLGEPVFDRLEADLAKAMLSLPATKGFEIGSGFAGTKLTGSQHNDAFAMRGGKVCTLTNRSGGVQGGISNGEELFFRVAFKPTATILQKQKTVDTKGKATELMGRGRHDPCVLPRAVPIVEAMTALVLVDHWLRQYAQNQVFEFR